MESNDAVPISVTDSTGASGSYMFRSSYKKRGTVNQAIGGTDPNWMKIDKLTGILRSSTFTLAAGDLTFKYSGEAGYVAVCKGTECKKSVGCSSQTVAMAQCTIPASILQEWVGAVVELHIVDLSIGGWSWGFLAVDDISFKGTPSDPPEFATWQWEDNCEWNGGCEAPTGERSSETRSPNPRPTNQSHVGQTYVLTCEEWSIGKDMAWCQANQKTAAGKLKREVANDGSAQHAWEHADGAAKFRGFSARTSGIMEVLDNAGKTTYLCGCAQKFCRSRRGEVNLKPRQCWTTGMTIGCSYTSPQVTVGTMKTCFGEDGVTGYENFPWESVHFQ